MSLATRLGRNSECFTDPKRLAMAVNSELMPSPEGNGEKLTTRELCETKEIIKSTLVPNVSTKTNQVDASHLENIP